MRSLTYALCRCAYLLSFGWFAVCANANPTVVIWDTVKPIAATPEASELLSAHPDWRAIPTELFAFEKNPAKAASDPGYYGRVYSFSGDAVIENPQLVAQISARTGRLSVFSKGSSAVGAALRGTKLFEVSAALGESGDKEHYRFEILRNATDEVLLRVSGASNRDPENWIRYSLGAGDLVEIKAGTHCKQVDVIHPTAYGVVPTAIGDDLVFDPESFPDQATFALPTEHWFLGLSLGENSQWVATWPSETVSVALHAGTLSEPVGKRLFGTLQFQPDGREAFHLCVSGQTAKGIWHRETFTAAYLEKPVASAWGPPYAAKWKTQLLESGVPTTFAFRDRSEEIWRGVPGSYQYPVWIENGQAHFHLSKKVPPKKHAIIYAIERDSTPLEFTLPVDVLKNSLGRTFSEAWLDPEGRQLRTHHRRGGDGVHRACTCGITEAIQSVFESGQESSHKDQIAEEIEDMTFFISRHVERIEEYRQFALRVVETLKASRASANVPAEFLDAVEPIAQQILQEYEVQKENMKSQTHTLELVQKTMALASEKRPGNLSAYMELLKAWRGMGGAQDYVVAQCHVLTRQLAQQAGYQAAVAPKALPLASKLRTECRNVLRHADGYEIWADY